MRTSTIRAVTAGLLLSVLASCGGGGGGGGGGADTIPPAVAITSPVSGITTFATSVVVTGTAADASGIANVLLNGVNVSTTNGFATWTGTVSLNNVGPNQITALAIDGAGNNATAVITVTRLADSTPPTAAIVSPLATAMTTGTMAVLRGTAADLGGVVGVSVTDGTTGWAGSSTDGFATWRAEVSVAAGTNTFTVSATDSSGNANPSAATATIVRSAPFVQRPTGIAYDALGARMVVCDISLDGVLGVTAAGATELLGGTGIGAGQAMPNPNDVTVLDGVAFTSDNLANTITRIDLSNGGKSVISGGGSGSGTAFVGLIGSGADQARDRLLVLDFHQQGFPQATRLMAVDPVSGARSVLSGNGVGSGVALGVASAVVHDTTADRYLTADSAGNLLAIDPVSGDRTELSGGTVGSGPALNAARDLVLAAPTRALVLVAPNSSNPRTFADILVSVDLTTGVRTAVTHGGVATPPELVTGLIDIEIDPADGALYLTESNAGVLYKVEFASATDIGAITQVEPATARVGSGPRLVQPAGLAYDPGTQRFFVAERSPAQVTAIDRSTAARSVLSSAGVGSGSGPLVPRRVEWDAAGGRLLLVDQTGGGSVFAVAPATGDRTLISADPAIAAVASVVASALDAGRNALLLGGSGSSALVRVDLGTGAATTVATLSASNATSSQVAAIGFDVANDRYVVADEDGNIFTVAAASGAVTLLFPAGVSSVDRPGAIVVLDPTNVFIYDSLDGEVWRVNLQVIGGFTPVVWAPSSGTRGGALAAGMVWEPTAGLLYLHENGTHALTVIDPASGNRMVLSR